MATIRDVAKKAGVSVATVSYVANGTRNVAPKTEERVRRAMAELDYHPNAAAQSLRTRSTHVVGLVISDISNPFFATLVRGAEDCARQNGYSILICNTSEKMEDELVYLQLLSRRRIDGMLLASTGKNDEMIRRLIERGMHIVFIDRKIDGVAAPAVLSENEEGAYQATSHLISLGHTRIGIVVGLPGVSTTTERLRGYEHALSDSGIPLDKALITYGGSQIKGAEDACKELFDLSDPPSAIFAGNNLMTIGVMKQLRELGISCPKDVSVVGFDDFEWASCFEPTLTMVAQDPYRIGFTAVEQLFKALSGKRLHAIETRIPTHLMVRGSSSSPNSKHTGG